MVVGSDAHDGGTGRAGSDLVSHTTLSILESVEASRELIKKGSREVSSVNLQGEGSEGREEGRKGSQFAVAFAWRCVLARKKDHGDELTPYRESERSRS